MMSLSREAELQANMPLTVVATLITLSSDKKKQTNVTLTGN